MIDAKDLVGLDFQGDQDFLAALRIVEEQKLYLELPGGNSLIVLREDLDGLVSKLKEAGITFSEVQVISAGDPSVKDITRKKRGDYIKGSSPD